MATTIGPEGDPTYLAFERARQYGDSTLQNNALRDQARAAEDVQRQSNDLGYQQADQLKSSLADYRNSGFGQSGLQYQAADVIRRNIAEQLGKALTDYQRSSQDTSSTLAESLAQSAFNDQEQQLQARARLTNDNATAGVGL